MTRSKWLVIPLAGWMIVWVVLSYLALGGLYKLWWERERADYFLKNASEQRVQIWQKSGLPQKLLGNIPEIEGIWPANTRYTLEGVHTKLSYASYLLIPRIPSSKAHDVLYTIRDDGSFQPDNEMPGEFRQNADDRSHFFGWALSVFCLCGITFGLKTFLKKHEFSFPEVSGLSLLFAMGTIVVARAACSTALPAFFLLLAMGGGGWLITLLSNRHLVAPRLQAVASGRGFAALDKFVLKRNIVLGVFIGIILLSVLWSFIMSVVVVPDDWDAWAIWGAKAKVLALGNGPLSDVTYFGHGDYPLLWPAIWAFSGFCSGGWEELWSRGWGSVFFVLCLWEIAVVIYRETNNNTQAFMGAALFASVPMAPLVTSWSYAEAPLWFLAISCFGVLLQWRRDGSVGYLIIAALLAVAAAYTKNDGMLFVTLISLWILMQQREHRLKGFFVFCSVFIACYLPWLYWVKWSLHLHSHATQGLALTADTLHHIWQRFPAAAGKILSMWLDIKQWSVVLWGSAVAWLFFFWNSKDKFSMLVPVCMILGFLTIILSHHDNVYWLVGTAWNRLTLQALPLLITILCIEFSRYGMEKNRL